MDSLENQQSSGKFRKLFSMSFIVSASAIFISVATLAVSVYQSRIMQSQQHASVWPYVEWTMGFSTVDGIFLTVKNKGVGPAIIKSTELTLDGQPIESSRELMRKLTNGRSDSIWSFTETVNKRVLSPGEEVRFFHIRDSTLRKMDFGDVYHRIKYNICYCSIYGDCWTSSGLVVEPDKCE